MSLVAALRRRRALLLLAAGVVVADQVSKLVVLGTLRGRAPVEVIPGFFDLIYSRNPGGLFGYFSNLGQPWRTLLLTALPLAAIALILSYLLRGDDLDRPSRVGLSLILGGAIGNLIDRLVRGDVVDFLDVYVGSGRLADWFVNRFGTAHWPTFNIADSCIVAGAGLLLLSVLWPRRGGPASDADDAVDS